MKFHCPAYVEIPLGRDTVIALLVWHYRVQIFEPRVAWLCGCAWLAGSSPEMKHIGITPISASMLRVLQSGALFCRRSS